MDGFAALRDEYQDVDGLPLLESFHRSYADGPEVGVHFAMTTTRVKAIPSAIDEVTTQKWLFRLADRYDYSSAGIKPEQMPADVNGRAVPVLTRLQTRIATPGCGARAAVEHIASRRSPLAAADLDQVVTDPAGPTTCAPSTATGPRRCGARGAGSCCRAQRRHGRRPALRQDPAARARGHDRGTGLPVPQRGRGLIQTALPQ